MSLAETEPANVEPFRKPTRSGVPTQLQQFAKFGLTLNIVDFRCMCEELVQQFPDHPNVDPHLLADILFGWMTDKLEQDAGK